MNKHVTPWLAAYYDRQLDPQRLAQVEDHLQVCPECRLELQSLGALSTLLGAWETPVSFATPQTALDQLPARTSAASSAQRAGLGRSHKPGLFAAPLIWAAPPLVLVAGWLFWQMAIVFSRLLDVLGLTAQLVLIWTPTLWRWPLFDLAPGPLTEILSAAGVAPIPGFAAVQTVFTQMFGLAALSVLLWGWLVFLWLFNRQKFGVSPLSENESG